VWRGRLSQNSTSESSEPVSMMCIRLSSKIGFKRLNKEEEQVKKDEPVKPRSNIKPIWI
jgi:hypothetical protein